MSEHDQPYADAARLLAEMHLSRSVARGIATLRPTRSGLATSELWAHARRAPGAAVSLAVERMLRTDSGIARRYRIMLASAAIAHAPFAAAAATGPVSRRRVGTITVEIDDGEPGASPLVLISGFGGRAPRLIEVMLGEETLRLRLPDPAGDTILLSADPALPNMHQLLRLLREGASEIFLL